MNDCLIEYIFSPPQHSLLVLFLGEKHQRGGDEDDNKGKQLTWCAPLGALAVALGSDIEKDKKKSKQKRPLIKTGFQLDTSFEKSPRINIKRLLKHIATEESCVRLLQNCSVLPTAAVCPSCDQHLTYTYTINTPGRFMRYARCSKKKCSRPQIPINSNTVMSCSNISLETMIMMVYSFIEGDSYKRGNGIITKKKILT